MFINKQMVAYEFAKYLKRNSGDIFCYEKNVYETLQEDYEKLERSFYEFINDNSNSITLELYESINIRKLIEYSVCIM